MDLQRFKTVLRFVSERLTEDESYRIKQLHKDSSYTYNALEAEICFNEYPMPLKHLRRLFEHSGFKVQFQDLGIKANDISYGYVCNLVESFGMKSRKEFDSLPDALMYNESVLSKIHFVGERF